MDELTTWLRTQIEQRKATAQKATEGPWSKTLESWADGDAWAITRPRRPGEEEYPTYEVVGSAWMRGGVWEEADADHIALNDPQDVIARCEAELALLDLHALEWRERPERVIGESDDPFCGECSGEPHPCASVRLVASGYQRWPGFKEQWHA